MLRQTIAIGAAVVFAAGCQSDNVITPPKNSVNTGLFKSYVALGNSISAGYQSGGILDSTQRESFAFLLAGAAGTRYAYPSLVPPGCPPPIVNFQTGARLGSGSTASSCSFRNPSSVTATLNNVAVPGAAVVDLTSTVTPNSNPLTQLILGGKTQVERALEASPTFVTVEIGNNDVLPAALTGLPTPVSGLSPGITPVDSFIVQYARAIDQLTKGAPTVKGVLIGVFDVTQVGALFPIDSAIDDPVIGAEVNAAAGHTILYAPDCTHSGALLSIDVLPLIATGMVQPEIGCADSDPFTLDALKQGAFHMAVAAYNAYIAAKADSIGFVYFDPNPLLSGLRTAGQIPAVPNFTSATEPFGPYLTLDGIHPSALAHQTIAAAMVAKIDSAYGVTLALPAAARAVPHFVATR